MASKGRIISRNGGNIVSVSEMDNISNPVIRLFKDEFSNEVWSSYCRLLGIDEEMEREIISVELEISRVLPQIH